MTLLDTTRRKIVIVGGGMGGMAVFTKIHNLLRHPDVTLIEPSTHCQYPLLWPLVGVGAARPCETQRELRNYLPEGSSWARDRAKKIDTKAHVVVTERGREVPYEYLVVCPELVYNPKDLKKLEEWLQAGHIHTTLDLDSAQRTHAALQDVSEGTVLIVSHVLGLRDNHTQSVLHLVDDYFRRRGIREKIKLKFVSSQEQLFPDDSVHKALSALASQKNIEILLRHRLVGLSPESQEAELAPLDEKGKPSKETLKVPYRFLHFSPEMIPPALVSDSKLIARREDFKGWLSVDPYTLQSTKEPNIFGLGDCANIPVPSSMQALDHQASVLAHNLVTVLQGRGPYFFQRYDGSTVFSAYMQQGQLFQTSLGYRVSTDDKGQQEVTGALAQRPPQQSLWQWLLMRHLAPRLYWRRHLPRT